MKTVVRIVLLGVAAAAWPAAATAADVLAPIDLRQVKVGGEIGRRIDVTIDNNLLVLKADKDFLAPFRAKKVRTGYVGLGKLIDAAVRFAAYTKDARVIALKKHLVDETIKTQEPDGYIGIMAAPHRMSGMWDIHEMGYMIFALTSDYQYFREKRSLEAARKAADYILGHWATMPADWPQQTHVATHVSLTGLERAMLALYRETGDQRYLDFCVRERALPEWDLGIVIGRRDLIEGHVYAYVARCLAQLELYRIQPDAAASAADAAGGPFSHRRRTAWPSPAAPGSGKFGPTIRTAAVALGETCATAYQIRLYDSLLRLEGNPRYGDLIERTIYNALFAAQSPDGRRIRYFRPWKASAQYYPDDTYCCPCNYRRIVAELPTMVYYRSRDGVAVNLYTPSEATMDLG